MPRRFYTSRKRAYRGHRDALAEPFAAAFDFLKGLELLCEGDHGFHMGTARHVQFYLGDHFLFHLAIGDSDGSAPWLELSPRHHGRLKEGTRDGAHLLFRNRIHRVVEQLAVPGKTVMRRGDAYRIACGAPLAFFRLLQGELLDIVASGVAQPWQHEMFAEEPPRKLKRRRRRKDPRAVLLDDAQEAEEEVAALVRALEAEIGRRLSIVLSADGAVITLAQGSDDQRREVRAESLPEAVDAVFAVVDEQGTDG